MVVVEVVAVMSSWWTASPPTSALNTHQRWYCSLVYNKPQLTHTDPRDALYHDLSVVHNGERYDRRRRSVELSWQHSRRRSTCRREIPLSLSADFGIYFFPRKVPLFRIYPNFPIILCKVKSNEAFVPQKPTQTDQPNFQRIASTQGTTEFTKRPTTVSLHVDRRLVILFVYLKYGDVKIWLFVCEWMRSLCAHERKKLIIIGVFTVPCRATWKWRLMMMLSMRMNHISTQTHNCPTIAGFSLQWWGCWQLQLQTISRQHVHRS